MREMKKSSRMLRITRAFCTLVIFGGIIFTLIGGFNMIIGAAVLASVASVAAPVVVSGGSAVDMLMEFFMALLEGVMAIIEGIVSVIGGIFG